MSVVISPLETETVLTSTSVASVVGARTYGLGAYVILFFILVSFIWIVCYSFNFTFLCNRECKNTAKVIDSDCKENLNADPGRCFVAAILIALVLMVLCWVFF